MRFVDRMTCSTVINGAEQRTYRPIGLLTCTADVACDFFNILVLCTYERVCLILLTSDKVYIDSCEYFADCPEFN